MPQYKKRKKHSPLMTAKRNKKIDSKINNDNFEIKMNANNKVKQPKKRKSEINVIKGKKPNRRLRIKTILCSLLALFIIFLICFIALPVGIIETFNNFAYSFGVGDYPKELYGSQIVDTAQQNNYYFALTNSQIYSITNSGKEIFSETHGFSKPVIKTSKTRAFVYNQSDNTYNIYTIKGKKISSKIDNEIITAAICNSGNYAIASFSSEYSSTVSVYNKKCECIFTWNCAKDFINNISLSTNGKRLAVSTYNAQNGEISSKVYLFNIKKTDALKTFEYDNEAVNSISSNTKGFFVITKNHYDFIKWSNGDKNENTTQKECNIFRLNANRAIIVLNRESNRSDNTVICLNKKGEKIGSFKINGNINDIKIYGSHIYCISDSKIIIYDIDGDLICEKSCGYEYKCIIPIGNHSAIAISDSQIQKFSIK